MPTDDGEMLVTPITKGTKIEAAWAGIEAAQRNRAHYKMCSMCRRLVPTDSRGEVLDSSGRCQECQP
jgi:hypothetical protein